MKQPVIASSSVPDKKEKKVKKEKKTKTEKVKSVKKKVSKAVVKALEGATSFPDDEEEKIPKVVERERALTDR